MKNICFHLNRKLWLTIALVLSVALPGLAQKITVHGYVDDELGEALIGATVMEKGTSNGTSTDIDGNFTLNVAPNATLVVSYIGYDPVEVAVNGQTNIKVTMKENATALQEAVVIGYGSVKKSDATGSVSVIKPDEIDAGISTSAQDLLVGASPGVVVTTDGGNPTGGATIRIRGGSSLSASNDPLIVIDGVPMTNQSQGGGMSALTMVNPNDIESMTVLKDASATAIYGSRASNGVIIITTKKGKGGKPVVNISANMTVNTARKTLNLMDGNEFASWVQNHLGQSSIDQLGYNGTIYNTDWQKEVLRTTISQDYTASVAGKAGFLPYRVNAGYTNSEGILKTSNMQRTTAGISLSPKFFDDLLSVNVNLNGTYARVRNADGSAIGGATSMDPTKPVYTNIPMEGNTGMYVYNGYYTYAPGGFYDRNAAINPLQRLEDVNSVNNTLSSSGNIQIDYALHFLPDLHLNLNLGYQVSKNDQKSITAANSVMAWTNDGLLSNNAAGASTLYKWHELQRNTLLDFYINYKKEFEAIKSNLDVMVGYSWQKMDYHGRSQNYVNSLGFVNANGDNGFSYDNGVYYMNTNTVNNIGDVVNHAPQSVWGNPLQLVSFFGRLNYTFDDTYLLTFTLRDDGSSRFSKDTRWSLFPSVALGWKIKNVGHLKDVDWLDEFKLRLGWGETGQQDIGGYFPYLPIYVNSYTPGFQYVDQHGNWIEPLYPQAYDANIKWETTTTWNAGFDLGFFNNRLTATIDAYLRNTRDLLAWAPALGMNTSNFMTTNIGSLRNYGVEVTLGGRPVQTQDFTWNTSVNVAWNHNEITALTGDAQTDQIQANNVPVGTGGPLQWHLVGEPAFTYLVYQQVYDADGNPVPGQFVDQNADGKIDDSDKIKFHSPDPKVTLTWNNNFSYKNWDLSFALRANMGNYVYNGPRYSRTNGGGVDAYGLNNLLRNEYIFPTTPDPLSDYFVENASFLRCDNITLGYTWPNLIDDHLRLRLYGAVQNPFVITKYKGLDPEVNGGIDNNVYPRPVSFTLGLIATF
ncbi:MAG: TonB-dependent receptor [Muribaculaceae bacterium]|nr:TonB-dependent receptor [Muribaculaceae bacterium]MDE6753714.1 TonB-dependent receptor [Muribaculaceae bacterium]